MRFARLLFASPCFLAEGKGTSKASTKWIMNNHALGIHSGAFVLCFPVQRSRTNKKQPQTAFNSRHCRRYGLLCWRDDVLLGLGMVGESYSDGYSGMIANPHVNSEILSSPVGPADSGYLSNIGMRRNLPSFFTRNKNPLDWDVRIVSVNHNVVKCLTQSPWT